jgi:hypothetical protein
MLPLDDGVEVDDLGVVARSHVLPRGASGL